MKAKLSQSIIGVLLLAGFVAPANSYGQSPKDCAGKYLENLPVDLKLEEKTPQKYLMITDAFDYDLLGNFIKKSRFSGEYTRGLENGNSKWNNVRISTSNKADETFSLGEKKEVMENFTYKSKVSKNIFGDSIFRKIPEPNVQFKILVWDMQSFEINAWTYFDSLKLNQEFSPKISNKVASMEGIGRYEVKDLRLTWIGITSKNNEICAIIKYSILNNPFNTDYMQVVIKGRSHVWGDVYVSLKDKQIEYAELYEDILMDIKMKGQDNNTKLNTTRNITLQKIQ